MKLLCAASVARDGATVAKSITAAHKIAVSLRNFISNIPFFCPVWGLYIGRKLLRIFLSYKHHILVLLCVVDRERRVCEDTALIKGVACGGDGYYTL